MGAVSSYGDHASRRSCVSKEKTLESFMKSGNTHRQINSWKLKGTVFLSPKKDSWLLQKIIFSKSQYSYFIFSSKRTLK